MPLGALKNQLKSPLSNLYIISSEELFLLNLGRALIIEKAQSQGFADKYVFSVDGSDFDWNNVKSVCSNLSLFGTQQIIDLRLLTDSIGKEGNKFLEQYAEDNLNNQDNLLVLSLLEYNIQKKESYKYTKSTWYKSLIKHTKDIKLPVPDRTHLNSWLKDRLVIHKLTASDDAIDFLAEHVEGNLFAGEQEIMKLNLAYGDNPSELSRQDIEKAIIHVAEYSLEELSEAVLLKQRKRALLILETLILEEFNIVYLAQHMTRDIRQLISFIKLQRENRQTHDIFRVIKVWQKERQVLLTKALKIIQPTSLVKALKQAFIVDKTIKGLEPHRTTKEELLKLVLILTH